VVRDELLRHYPLLDPPLERLQEVVVGVDHMRVNTVTEDIRPSPPPQCAIPAP
jgi:hypothetical protein